ncbi:MAG TPA: polysaccharide biosynthesis C-terminal domain-containing protein, partial [Lachnospiraceae bacterium]|nr:polysaccharide biosynthesis C-terminal domain-containing protein [Lachnospiraceae bacterium]
LVVKRGEKASAHSVTEKELLTYGIPFIPMLLMEWLLSSMDKWSIKIFNDFSQTGIYSAAMQIMTILLTFKITYVAFWAPVAMEKYETQPEEVCKAFFADMFRKVQFLCMSAAFLLTICRGIIVLILGERYREAIRIIPFLTLMPVLSILFEMTGQGVKFVGKIKYFNYASLAAIICNLTGNLLLVPKFGGVGAALATAVTYVVYFFTGTFFSKKCYPVNYRFREFIWSLCLYKGYAAFATVTDDQWLSAFVGILLFALHCVFNREVFMDIMRFGTAALKRIRQNRK